MHDNPPTGPEKENIPATPKPKRLSAAQQKIADAAVAAAAEKALAEIELLKEQLEASNRARDAAREAARMAETQGPGPDPLNNSIIIIKPKGEAGDSKRGFNLREAMDLEGDANKVLYEAIQRSIKRGAYKAGIDFSADYRRQDAEQLAAVFKYVRKHHPYMTRNRFPADWAAGEMLKQFLRNHRRYEVKKGRMQARRASNQGVGFGGLQRIDAAGDEENSDGDDDIEYEE